MPSIICNQGQPQQLGPKDQQAIAEGYTRRVYIEGGSQEGSFLIQPEADLDGRFKAWGIDWEEWTWVHGSNCLIEDEEA
jgi:hypothetical protein